MEDKMSISKTLLKARSIGIRNFRNSASKFIGKHQFLVITEHGTPASVLLPYNDVLEIVDILEELEDKKTLKAVTAGRRSIKKGAKGILAAKIFKHN